MERVLLAGGMTRPAFGPCLALDGGRLGLPLSGGVVWQSWGGGSPRHPARGLPRSLEVILPRLDGPIHGLTVVGVSALFTDGIADGTVCGTWVAKSGSQTERLELRMGDQVVEGSQLEPRKWSGDDGSAVRTVGLLDLAGLPARVDVIDLPLTLPRLDSLEFVAGQFAQPGADRPIDKALRLDTTVMLVDDPVKRVDNMTMAWGLEARVPFLDHELVELAARVPAELKLAQDGKGILKDVGRRVIPAEVIDRPKGYFPVPALKYIEGPVLDMVRDVLTSAPARQRGLFRQDYVATLLANPKDHITRLRGSKLWQIALLEMWLQTNGI